MVRRRCVPAIFWPLPHRGSRYATIQDVLLGGLLAALFLALLWVSKLAATSLSLGSGSSGGIFSPSLLRSVHCRCLWRACPLDISNCRNQRSGFCHGWHGRHGWRRDRCGDDRSDHDLRDDARLRHRHAHDHGGCDQHRLSTGSIPGEHLYDQIAGAEALHPEGASRKHVLCPARGRSDGQGCLYRRTRCWKHSSICQNTRLRFAVVVTHENRILGVLRVNTALRRGLEGAFVGVSLGEVADRAFTVTGAQRMLRST